MKTHEFSSIPLPVLHAMLEIEGPYYVATITGAPKGLMDGTEDLPEMEPGVNMYVHGPAEQDVYGPGKDEKAKGIEVKSPVGD